MDIEVQYHRRHSGALEGDRISCANDHDYHPSDRKAYSPARMTLLGLFWLRHFDRNSHAQFVAWIAEICAGERRRLGGIARHRDTDKVLAADQPIGWIKFDPSGARQINLAPRMRRPSAQTDRLAVVARDIHIPRDKTRSDSERARRLHHQDREVAAGAAPPLQRMARRLYAWRLAPLVGEPFLDRIGQSHQQMAGQRRRPRRHELAHPAVEVSGRIAVEALNRPSDVGQFFRGVGKGEELRPRVDLAARLIVDDALDRELVLDGERG